MRQYEIWWADLDLPSGRRPVLLLSRDSTYRMLTTVTVVEITSRERGIPTEVRIGRAEGLPRPSVANLQNLRSVSTKKLLTRAGTLRREAIGQVKAAVGVAFDWPELTLG